VRSASPAPKVVAFVVLVAFACPVFAQQTPIPEKERKRKTRVCAIEDQTRVNSPDNPSTSRTLTPGYCIDCWEGFGCGEPFLAAGLLGLIGGPATAAAAGAVAVGGVLGGLSATGNLGGGGGGKGNPPPTGVPTPPAPPTPLVLPTEIPLPKPSPTSPPVSPFH
jgi:hypothetical protein